MQRPRFNRHRSIHLLIAVLLILSVTLPLVSTNAAGPPIYPDLVTPSPDGLRVTREYLDGAYHYLLRFDNTVVNQGGRLELTADLSVSRDVYQNVYDAKIGGTRVVRTRVGSDLIFHPQHNHFHFEGIASYELLKKNTTGHYLATQFRGTKTSYCIIDYVRISSSARTTPQYEFCNASVQGLSAGWGDLYYSSLPEQWVDLGTTMLPDGDYALQSIANPQRKIKESDTSNNTGVRYFTIRNGALVTSGQSPACTATPSNVKVGDTVQLSCTRITVGTTVDIRWGSTGGPLLKTIVSGEDHKALTSVTIPAASSGAYPIFAVIRSSGNYYGAVVNVGATVSISPTTQSPGGSVSYNAQGYSGGETVNIAINGSTVATKAANQNGQASGSFVLPPLPRGTHTLSAVGATSGGTASTNLTVAASISVNPTFAHVETSISPVLNGFQGGETVNLSIQGGPSLTSVAVNSSGSASAPATLPASVLPGNVTLVATGQSSGASATTTLLVLAAGADTPTATAIATSTPTEVAVVDTRRVTTALNMRSGPGTGYSIVQVLPRNTVVTVTGGGQNDNGTMYVPIRLQNGNTGWVAERYLQSVTPPPTATTGGSTTPTATSDASATVRTTTRLNLRSGAGTTYPSVEILPIGTILTVTGSGVTSGGFTWIPVRKSNGTSGWVADRYVQAVAQNSSPTATSASATSMQTTASLNLRSGPGTTYTAVEILPSGTIVTVTGPGQASGGYTWLPVRKSNGTTGWVASLYLRAVAGPLSPLETSTPVTQPTLAETAISAPASPIRLDDSVLRWLPEIQSASQASGIPADVLAGVIHQTSGGDPNVTGPNGSTGLMLVAPDEFASLGISSGWYDPATNITAGAATLAQLRAASGSIEAALAAYFGAGCTSAGYCGQQFATDVLASAAVYSAAINDPVNASYTRLSPDWVAPSVAPYAITTEVRPVPAAPVQIASTATSIEAPPTATTEPVVESPTDVPSEVPPTDVPADEPASEPAQDEGASEA